MPKLKKKKAANKYHIKQTSLIYITPQDVLDFLAKQQNQKL
jgi:hypothetical protein